MHSIERTALREGRIFADAATRHFNFTYVLDASIISRAPPTCVYPPNAQPGAATQEYTATGTSLTLRIPDSGQDFGYVKR